MTARYLPLHRYALLGVADDPLLQMIGRVLALEDWRCEVVVSRERLLAHLDQKKPNLVMLDGTMMRLHAIPLLQDVRAHTLAPVLLLTQREDRLLQREALSKGADGYLMLPFSLEVMLDQIQVLLDHEHGSGPFSSAALPCGVKAAGRVGQGGKDILLTPVETRVLRVLMHQSGQVMRSEELLTQIWGTAYRHEDPLLVAYIQRLRTKLEDDPLHPRHIHSPSKETYVFSP